MYIKHSIFQKYRLFQTIALTIYGHETIELGIICLFFPQKSV